MPTTPFVRDADNTINLDTNYNQLNQKAKTLADDLVDYVEDQTQAAVGAVDTKIAELASVGDSTYTVDAVDVFVQAQPQAAFDAEAQAARDRFAGSGFIEYGKHYVAGGYTPVNQGITADSGNINRILFGYPAGSGSSKTDYPTANINGRMIAVRGSKQTSFTTYNHIDLPQAPAVHTLPNRYDLAFLEVWDELVSEKDMVFPYGNVQFSPAAYEGISLVAYGTASYSRYGSWDTSPTAGNGSVWSTLSKANKIKYLTDPANNIRMTPDGLVQTRYRIRVVAGPIAGEPTNIALNADLRYDGSNYLKAQGKLVAIAADTNGAYSDSLGFYAPYHRAEFSYDIGAFGALNAAGNGKDFTVSYSGECFAVPIAMVSRRNTGAFHPQFNPNGSARFLDTDNTTESMWYATDQTITSTADCFTHGSGGAIADGAGSCGRPDGLYYDAIYASDVRDLRYSAHKLELSSEQVNRSFQDDIFGFRRGYESSPSVVTAGTVTYPSVKSETMLWCDIIGDSAEYPAGWAANPILGHRLLTDEAGASYIPNGSRTVYKLKRKAGAAPVLVIKGSTVMAVTTDWTFSTTTNAITFVVAPISTDVIQVFYATKASPYIAQAGLVVKALGHAYSENDYARILTGLLSGKIGVGSAAPSVKSLGPVSGHDFTSGGIMLGAAEYRPTHPATIAFGTTASPAVKVLPYISTSGGIAYLVMIFKELKHDSTDWGDDQKFVVADGFTTTTDDNAATVACGQASVELPFFVRS